MCRRIAGSARKVTTVSGWTLSEISYPTHLIQSLGIRPHVCTEPFCADEFFALTREQAVDHVFESEECHVFGQS